MRPGLEVRAERALALVADEQDRGGRIVDQVAQVADDPPAGQHPVRGHDHVRPRGARDRLRRLDVVGDDLVRVVERRLARAQERRRLLVVVVRVVAVDVGRLRGHRRVEVQRQERDLAALDQPIELPDDLLGATDREGRDEQDAAGIGDHPDRLGQDPDRLVFGLVLAAAVGRFDEHVVGVGHRRRVAQDRRARAGRGRPRRRSTRSGPPSRSVTRDADDRRAEDVAGVDERGMDARARPRPPRRSRAARTGRGRPRRPWRCTAARRGRCRAAAAALAARPPGRAARSTARSAAGSARLDRSSGRARRSRSPGRGRASARRRSALAAARLVALARARQLERRLRTRRPAGGRRPRPCRGGASPSARRASRTPRGACPSRAGRASPARPCRPSRGSGRGSRT